MFEPGSPEDKAFRGELPSGVDRDRAELIFSAVQDLMEDFVDLPGITKEDVICVASALLAYSQSIVRRHISDKVAIEMLRKIAADIENGTLAKSEAATDVREQGGGNT